LPVSLQFIVGNPAKTES